MSNSAELFNFKPESAADNETAPEVTIEVSEDEIILAAKFKELSDLNINRIALALNILVDKK